MKIKTNIFLLIIALPCLIWGQPKVLFEKHTLIEDYSLTMSVVTEDLDGDGDMDILGAGYGVNDISCWENLGNHKFQHHVISSEFQGPRTVYAVDLDRDGDKDILATGNKKGTVVWWECQGSYQYEPHTIGTHFVGSHTACAADLDGDNDLDVIASAWSTDGIHYWENDGNQNFTEHVLDEENNQYPCVTTVDMDGDSDIDIVGCCWGGGDVFWWENDSTHTFTKHLLDDSFTFVHWVAVNDVDQDGDMDVLAASYGKSQVAWYENDGAQTFTKHLLPGTLKNATSVTSVDLDGDGDIDILSAAETANEIRWWENDGHQNFTPYSIALDFGGASHVHVTDLDKDGDIDVLGAGRFINEIAWWESINEFIIPKINFSPKSGHAPKTILFSDSSFAKPDINSWQWDFDNDGTIDSDQQHPEWTYEKAGRYTVKVILSNGIKTEEVTLEEPVRIFEGECGLLFDGDKAYAVCPDSTSPNFSEQITVEAWIKPTGWGTMPAFGFGHIIDKGNVSFYLNGIEGMFNVNSLLLFINTEGSVSGYANSPDSSITLNEWQHVAVSYESSSSTVKLYINGIEQELSYVGEQPSGAIEDNSDTPLFIGSSEIGFTFDGIIDELRIWESVRTQDEIQAGMQIHLNGNETGLVNYWLMNEGEGNSTMDCTANGNHAQLHGAIWDLGHEISQPTRLDDSKKNGLNLPDKFILFPNFPNPFNPTTTISFHLPDLAPVKLSIYDIQGRKVKTLVNENEMASGEHSIQWNGLNETGQQVSSGIYFSRFEAGEFTEMQKMILVK